MRRRAARERVPVRPSKNAGANRPLHALGGLPGGLTLVRNQRP